MLSVFACDYFNPRFDTEQVPNIENVLILLRDNRQSLRVAGDFLYSTT